MLRSTYRVLAGENEDLALISLERDADDSWVIRQLEVHPDERKIGAWGASLMRLVCRHADHDQVVLTATVVPDRDPEADPAMLRVFYERLGFTVTPNDDDTFEIRRVPRG